MSSKIIIHSIFVIAIIVHIFQVIYRDLDGNFYWASVEDSVINWCFLVALITNWPTSILWDLYKESYAEISQSAYERGYSSGYLNGLDDGNEKGYKEGYRQGFEYYQQLSYDELYDDEDEDGDYDSQSD